MPSTKLQLPVQSTSHDLDISRDSLTDDEISTVDYFSAVRVIDQKETLLHSSSGRSFKFLKVVKKTVFGKLIKAVQISGPPFLDSVHCAASGKGSAPSKFVAIKFYSKSKIDSMDDCTNEDPYSELEISEFVYNRHSNVLGCIECCTDADYLYHIMPFLDECELFDHVTEVERLDETQTKRAMRQVFEGLQFLHAEGIAHRDLSLENLLYHPETEHVTIIDFGLGIHHRKHSFSHKQPRMMVPTIHTGKRQYVAPEVLAGVCTVDACAVDVWAAGICVLYLLLGFPPIMEADSDDDRFMFLKTGRYYELVQHWGIPVSKEAVEFAQFILQIAPNERPSVSAILSHPWLQQSDSACPEDEL